MCRHVFTGVLKYAYELLTLDTFMKLPGDLQVFHYTNAEELFIVALKIWHLYHYDEQRL